MRAGSIDAGIFLDLLSCKTTEQIDLVLSWHHADFEVMARLYLGSVRPDIPEDLPEDKLQAIIVAIQAYMLSSVSKFLTQELHVVGSKPRRIARMLTQRSLELTAEAARLNQKDKRT